MSDNMVNDIGDMKAQMLGAYGHNVESAVPTANSNTQGIPRIDLSTGLLNHYGANFAAHAANTGYTPRNIIPILLEAPRGAFYLPSPDKFVQTLKSLIETQAKTIEGLRSGLTVSKTERDITHGGHKQSDPSKVTAELSKVSYTYDERYGKSIHKFWLHYIRMLIGNEITQQPDIMSIRSGPEEPSAHLSDFYSFTALFIEPDPLQRYAIDAWLISNMWPEGSGTLESRFSRDGSYDVPETSVEFTGFPVQSIGVTRLAQEILDKINYLNAGPMHQPAHVSITSDAIADAVGVGARENLGSYHESGAAMEENNVDNSSRYVSPRDASVDLETTDQMGTN